jgi:hypothetical protein
MIFRMHKFDFQQPVNPEKIHVNPVKLLNARCILRRIVSGKAANLPRTQRERILRGLAALRETEPALDKTRVT